MLRKRTPWKKGRGTLGALAPLLGAWKAEVKSPDPASPGNVRCTRMFQPILAGKYVQLIARWEFARFTYEELALFGLQEGRLAFWSFTSDGKRSQGTIAPAEDIHPRALAFEADMGARRARMIYWPHEAGGFNWAVEAKTRKGWRRFTEHHYVPL